jgi:hypothetical protein
VSEAIMAKGRCCLERTAETLNTWINRFKVQSEREWQWAMNKVSLDQLESTEASIWQQF